MSNEVKTARSSGFRLFNIGGRSNKKIAIALIIAVAILVIYITLLTCTVTVFAGSMPEDLLGSDEAMIFFGEVVSYDSDQTITVLPIRKIKGDVDFCTEQTYKDGAAIGNGITVTPNVYCTKRNRKSVK